MYWVMSLTRMQVLGTAFRRDALLWLMCPVVGRRREHLFSSPCQVSYLSLGCVVQVLVTIGGWDPLAAAGRPHGDEELGNGAGSLQGIMEER